ncbi:UDP-N-acetylglucosamine 2-epimerase (non-hydrolyzing) [Marine Group III euryarchaeote]|nr:UDP-N-acetylglucosamine 2-epimerase (non-hydrolyzing) [Marine Group III euryarchaeote]
MKIVCIVGARPQFVKLAPFLKALNEKRHKYTIIHTGQHYDDNLSKIFFEELNIGNPDYNLEIGSDSQARQTAKMMVGIEEILNQVKPDWVVLFGDTNSTLAGSLASSKMNVKTAHVEAGLRSFNRNMPEEINRVVADQLADILLVPSVKAYQNLINEGMKEKSFQVGDLMADNIYHFKDKISLEILNKMEIEKNEYYVATIHRPYNTDTKKTLVNVLSQIDKVDKNVIFPIHPRTKNIIDKYRLKESNYPNIKFIESVGFLDFQSLQKNSGGIITDSGGIQKEAYLWKKPCFTIRSETEWTETVENGWNTLINHKKDNLKEKILKWEIPTKHYPFYGNGHSAYEIIKYMEKRN